MAKKKRKKLKKPGSGDSSQTRRELYIGWIGFVVLFVLLLPVVWFVLSGHFEESAEYTPRFLVVFFSSLFVSGILTTLIDTILRRF